MNPMTLQPDVPASEYESDLIWFPVRVTSAPGGGVYVFQEVWTTPGGVIADKTAGRFNTASDPAYAIDGGTYTTTSAGSAVVVQARRAPGSGGVAWEMSALGSGSDPDASLTVRGYVSTGTQSFAGLKTFRDNIQIGHPGSAGSGSTFTMYDETGANKFSIGVTSIGATFNCSALFFSNAGAAPALHVGPETGMTTSVVVGAQTLNFTSGLLTSIT